MAVVERNIILFGCAVGKVVSLLCALYVYKNADEFDLDLRRVLMQKREVGGVLNLNL